MAAVAKFAIVTSGLMMMMPLYRLIEDAICHVHYEDDSADLIEEMKCKVDEVQTPLAFMLGWFGLLHAVMSESLLLWHLRQRDVSHIFPQNPPANTHSDFIVAYPYGILSDTIGRKPIILMAYGAQAVSFCLTPFALGELRMIVRENPYILLWGTLFTLIGGGVPVLMSTFYAIAADVSTEKDK